MKKVSLFILFVVLVGSASAESAIAPTPSPASLLSFSLTPDFMADFGTDRWFGPGLGATVSCKYRLPASSLYAGADLGYSLVTLKGEGGYPSGSMSMLQAGLSVGIHLDILPTVGIRGFGSAGYSYNFVQPRVPDDFFEAFFHPVYSTARGGTPFVCAGAELSWSFIPALSLTAGAKYRYFLDLYSGLAVTLGISCNFLVGGAQAAKPATQRVAPPATKAVPLKNAPHPQPPTKPEGAMIEKLSLLLMPEEPAVLLLSDQIKSFVKPNMNRAIDKNLQSAIGFHEALLLLGIASVSPPMTSSAVVPENKAADSVKFSLQTLQDRWGDCSDLSILYSSLLESVQVETAFITTPGHVFIAFALASGEEETRKTFSHADEFIFRDGKVWVPIDVTEREGSFLTAWQAGAKEWRKARKQAHFYPVGAVGNAHEPLDSLESGSQLPLPDQAQLVENFQQEVARLVEWEIHDREAELMAAVSKSNGSPNTLNALGVLYARYDLLEKAEAQFQAALKTMCFVKRKSPGRSRGIPHQPVGIFAWPLCLISACFIR